jgi:putative transcriptional regulator
MSIFTYGNDFSISELVGSILIATPYRESEACFKKSIICILADDHQGTLGVIVNKQIKGLTPEFIYTALEVDQDPEIISNKKILFGGPVDNEKGLILHSNDYKEKPLIKLEELSVSSNIKLLGDIASMQGPKDYQIIIGYSAWQPGQLADEIKNNAWLVMPYCKKMIFGENHTNKWNMAIKDIGLDQLVFSSISGTA